MTICGHPQKDGDQDDIVLNPILIAEVLSEPTQYLTSIECALPLAEIYGRIDFSW